jgi:hypothetical protein
VIVREQVEMGPAGRRALFCELQERLTRDIALMDLASRGVVSHYKARTVITQEPVDEDSTHGDLIEAELGGSL